MASWYLTSPKMSVRIDTDDNGTITDVAPVTRKFVGQHIDNLKRWMQCDRCERIDSLTSAQEA